MTEARESPATLVVAELALVGVTLAACLGLSRLFDDASFLPPVVLVAVTAHLLAAAGRRQRLSAGMLAGAVLVAGTLGTSLLLYGFATWWGLPGPDVVRIVGRDLHDAWEVFVDLAPPVPPRRGFVLLVVALLWPLAVLADRAAFVQRSPALALVPAGSLFVATSLFEASRHRLVTTMAVAMAALAFVAVHRIDLSGGASSPGGGRWLPHDHTRGAWALSRAGTTLAAGVIVVTAVLGPSIPGLDGAALVDWRTSGGGDGSRVTVSPLVDIRTRLVDLSAQEVFTVRSPVRAYWRLTALDTFNGTIWASDGSYEEADGELPGDPTVTGPTTEVAQRFTITGLGALWIPAALEARNVNASDEIRWDAASATLVVDSDRTTSDELAYDVTSAVPAPSADALRAATEPPPAEIAEQYLDLPRDFSESARTTATSAAGGAASPYDAALALQDFFRANFRYSTDVSPGHAAADIDDFLDPENGRVGYCEQFAGTYAALARAVGLPARVAVGFTPGDLDDEGVFHVRGEHAHAWPEVHFTGIGWVPFEPTPTRGAPGAEAFTGVPEAQATPVEGTSGPAPFPTVVPGADQGDQGPATLPDSPEGSADDAHGPSPTLLDRMAQGALVVGALLAAYLLLVPLLHLGRRSARRRRAGRGPGPAVLAAWRDTLEAWDRAGVRAEHSETPVEIGHRADAALRIPGSAGTALAGLVSGVAYGAGETGGDAAAAARSLAGTAIGRARETTRWTTRVGAWLDPRPLKVTPRA